MFKIPYFTKFYKIYNILYFKGFSNQKECFFRYVCPVAAPSGARIENVQLKKDFFMVCGHKKKTIAEAMVFVVRQ